MSGVREAARDTASEIVTTVMMPIWSTC